MSSSLHRRLDRLHSCQLAGKFAGGIDPAFVRHRSDSVRALLVDPHGVRSEHLTGRKVDKGLDAALAAFFQDIDRAEDVRF